jgi:hypothetical protein
VQLGQWVEEHHRRRHLHRVNSDEAVKGYDAAAGLAGRVGARNLTKEEEAAAEGSDLVRLQEKANMVGY